MKKFVLLFFATLAHAQTPESDQGFLETYPALDKLTYKEPASGIYFGLGLAPFGLNGSKFGAGMSAFQFHFINNWLDWEVINGGFSFAFGSVRTNYFTFRSAPKYRINRFLSIGALVGYEVASFPNVDVKLQNRGLETQPQPFSSRGLIYGIAVSENFERPNGSYFKINQIVYQETYSNTKTTDGWNYFFINAPDAKLVEASTVFALEVSYLF